MWCTSEPMTESLSSLKGICFLQKSQGPVLNLIRMLQVLAAPKPRSLFIIMRDHHDCM